jgi:rhodanese-related sulfurtransferase
VGDRAGKTELFEQFARVGRALASGKRLELLDLLAQGERTVEALADAAGLGVTIASNHLQTLKQAHLVRTRRDGVRIHYSLAGDDVAQLYAMLRTVAGAHLAEVRPAWLSYLGMAADEATAIERADVAREELARRVADGRAVVLDVRPEVEHRAGHIPGALSIPIDQLADRLDELPAGAEVIAYCRGTYCVMAYEAVALLRRHGRSASLLDDGLLEWRLAGLPIATGPGA